MRNVTGELNFTDSSEAAGSVLAVFIYLYYFILKELSSFSKETRFILSVFLKIQFL